MVQTVYNLTYSRLKTLINDACRQFPTYSTLFEDNIDNFIAEASYRVAGDCKTLPLKLNTLETINSTLIAGRYTLQKPALWYRTTFMSAVKENDTNQTTLKKRSYAFCRYLNNQLQGTSQLFLRYYCDDYSDSEYYFAPISTDNFSLSISYYTLPTPLGDGIETNTLTQNVPDLLKSASLIFAYDFINDYEAKSIEEANYAAILTRYNMTDRYREKSDYDSDSK